MKRKLLLLIILLIEALFICAGIIPSFQDALNPSLPFVVKCGNAILSYTDKLSDLVHLSSKINEVIITRIIVLAVLNILFICLYLGIFAIIISANKSRRRKIRRKAKVTQYVLTPEEEKNYEWKLYIHKFPIKRIISLIIPLFALFIFIIARFDKQVCLDSSSHLQGFTSLYRDTFMPFINKLGNNIGSKMIDFFTNSKQSGYIDLMNRLFKENIAWIEYIILGLGSIIIVLLWWGIFSLFAKMFRKHNAKKKAKNAREKYINKMEEIEYKARKKEKNKISAKAEDLLVPPSPEPQKNDAELIASIPEQEDKQVDTRTLKRQADYIDDISAGVIDLGIVKKEEEISKPIIERETTFVGDTDVDIVLEEEPVIEVVEEEAIDEFDNNEEDDPFFEKYQPEYVDTSKIEAFLDKEQVEVHEEGYEETAEEESTEESVAIKEYVEPQSEGEKNIDNSLEPEKVTAEEEIKKEPETESADIVEETNIKPEENVEEKQSEQNKVEVHEELEEVVPEEEHKAEENVVTIPANETKEETINDEPASDNKVEEQPDVEKNIEDVQTVEDKNEIAYESKDDKDISEISNEEQSKVEKEEAEPVLEKKVITPISVPTKKEVKVEPVKKEPVIIKPLKFKPKDNGHKNIKPISVDSPKEETVILKKYQTSMIKNDGELSPSEAFSQGISRVAPTIKPVVSEGANQSIKGPVPIIKKDQIKEEPEAPKRRNLHPLREEKSDKEKIETVEELKK